VGAHYDSQVYDEALDIQTNKNITEICKMNTPKICKRCGINFVSPTKSVGYCRSCESKRTLFYLKKTNYASEKTKKQRKMRYIKRETRRKYPLEGNKCKYCNKPATEHHHNTKPIKIDSFEYVCHKCHIKANKKYKEVIK